MTKRKLLSKICVAAFALVMPFAISSVIPASTLSSYALSRTPLQDVTITNNNFDGISYDHSSNSVNGWAPRWGNVATMMIFDVEENFSTNCTSVYYLKPDTLGTVKQKGTDDKILMINSATSNPTSSTFESRPVHDGYISDNISLQPNSYYAFNVSVKTASFKNNDEGNDVTASIYISSTDDNSNKITVLSQEGITDKTWTTYYFFMSTGSKAETITIDLWLGSETESSEGVAFFDSVGGVKIAEYYYNEYYNLIKSYSNTVVLMTDRENDREIVDTADMNFDFEDNNSLSSLVGWHVEPGTNGKNGYAKVITMDEYTFSQETILAYDGENENALTYPGDDYSLNNKKSLVMYANDGYITVTSLPLKIRQFGVYKITAHVKPADLDQNKGGFSMTLRETDAMKNEFKLDHYEPMTASLASPIKANGSDKTINYYNEVTMYIKGHNRYDSEIEILLSLGSETDKANGGIVVDNITVEYVGSEEFTATSSLELSTNDYPDAEIVNGFFNDAASVDKKFEFPVKPASFTLADSGSNDSKSAGIINIYENYFNEYSSLYNYDFAKGISNPGDPDPTFGTKYANNIFMFYNAEEDYQSLTSANFTVGKGLYRKLSFKFRCAEEYAKINVKLIDSDGYLLLNDIGQYSNGWATYETVIYGGESSTTMSLVIEFGNKDIPMQGHVFIDDIQIKTIDETLYEKEELEDMTDVDLSNFRIKLDPNGEISHNLSDGCSFIGSHDSGAADNSNGGIVAGEGNDVFQYRDENGDTHFIDDGSLKGNVHVIYTKGNAAFSLTSTNLFSTEDESYYALKFRLLTSFPGYNGEHKHDDEDVPFGLRVSLDGFDAVENLQSNYGWQEFTIIFNSTTAKSDSKLKFTLSSDCMISAGYVYITDIEWTTSSKTAFENAAKSENTFTSSISTENNDDQNNDNDDTDTNTDSGNGISDSMWLLIPSIIMAVAVIVAVVGFSIRHVKVKKVEKKRKEEYDRTDTVLENAIVNEAKETQKAEIAAVEKDIAELENELKSLEETNKQNVAKSREEGKVTKEIEREFKSFAQKRGKIQKQIDELNEHKSLISSPDYLLTIEKRIRAQKANENKK